MERTIWLKIVCIVYIGAVKTDQISYVYLPLPVEICFSIKYCVGLGTTPEQHLLKRLNDLVDLRIADVSLHMARFLRYFYFSDLHRVLGPLLIRVASGLNCWKTK